jgi:hypothetical protein
MAAAKPLAHTNQMSEKKRNCPSQFVQEKLYTNKNT